MNTNNPGDARPTPVAPGLWRITTPVPGRPPEVHAYLAELSPARWMLVDGGLGTDDAHHARYVDYLKTRTYICDMWRRHPWDDETLAEIAESLLANTVIEDWSVSREPS